MLPSSPEDATRRRFRVGWARFRRLVSGPLLYLFLTLGPLGSLAWAWVRRAAAGDGGLGLTSRTLGLLLNSLRLSATVAVLAGVLGLGVAIWLVSGRGRARVWMRRLFIAPFLIPPYLYALTWMALLARQGVVNRLLQALLGVSVSPYGFATAAMILSLAYAPLVALLALNALEAVPGNQVQAARVLASDGEVWRRVVLPLAYPALVGGMGLVFALTMVEYGVPALMQFNTYSMEIMAEFSQGGDAVQALALALPVLAASMLAVALSLRAWGRRPLRPQPGDRALLADLAAPGRLRALGAGAVALAVVGTLLPVVTLVVQSGWGRGIVQAMATARPEIGLSLGLALLTAVAATLLALPSARLMRDHQGGWLWALYALPLAVPAPLYGVGLVHMWNRPWGAAVYGGLGMLALAHIGRTLPLAVFACVLQLRRADPDLFAAARLYDVGWTRRALRVNLPLLAPGLLTAAVLVFVLSLGELGASLLVVPAGMATVSLRLYNLLHYGAGESVAGLALLVLLLVAAGGGLALARWRVR